MRFQIRPLIGACTPGHHGYQRDCVLITGQTSSGPFVTPVFAGKLIKGKKRHILVDTLGLLHAIVHAADGQDRDGGLLLLATLFGKFQVSIPRESVCRFADSAYQCPIFADGLAKILA
jgi:hypothetical protein